MHARLSVRPPVRPPMRLSAPLALLLLATALAGCSDGGGEGAGAGAADLSPEEAEERAEQALASFQASLADPTSGNLKAIEGTFTAPLDPEKPDGAVQNIDLHWEWGSNEVMHMRVTTDAADAYGGWTSGEGAATVDLWCGPDRMMFQFGDQAIEAPTEEGGCMGQDALGDDPFSFAEDAPGVYEDIQVHPDGSLTLTYFDGSNEGAFHVDPAGRLSDAEFEGEAFSGTMTFHYGERRALEMPEPSEDLSGFFGSG